MDQITYRLATIADLDSLVALRTAFIREVAESSFADSELQSALQAYFSKALPSGDFVAYLALCRGQVIATSGMVFHRQPPTPWNLQGVNAYVMNMFTLPAWRHQGIATTLLQLLVSYASERQCQRISLHTMPQARHLYTGVGFMPSDDELVLDLRDLNAGG